MPFTVPVSQAQKITRCEACRRSNWHVDKVCPECEKPFRVGRSKAPRFARCSRACREVAASRLRQRWSCDHCGTPCERAPSQLPHGRFCSVACQSAAAQVTKPCEWCETPFTLPAHRAREQRFCSISCSVIARLEAGPPFGYLANKIRSGYRTDIERRAEAVLIECGVAYEFEKKIGRYSVDFALHEMRIALECDGWHHARTAEKDAARDAYLTERGWTVVRIPGADLVADPVAAVTEGLGLVAA